MVVCMIIIISNVIIGIIVIIGSLWESLDNLFMVVIFRCKFLFLLVMILSMLLLKR